ncbi:hypothetical protein EDD11_009280 [Mortierella claussenii]|nr:hypothetical protein EDD11_009280 [Mortierella claussenii]
MPPPNPKLTNPNFYIEPCTQDEAFHYFYSWSVSEHWNPGAQGHDIRNVFYLMDPQGFFLGKLSASSTFPQDHIKYPDDKVVSMVSAVRYGQSNQGWIGYYLVDPSQRGQGFGLAGFLACLDHLKDCSSVGLDGVMGQVENYKRIGFTHINWQNERRNGSVEELLNHHLAGQPLVQQIRENKIPGLIDIAEAPVEGLAALEKKYSGQTRPEFLRQWAQFHGRQQNAQYHGRFGVAAVLSTRNDDVNSSNVLGFGCVRRAESSYRVGPLYAVSGEIAKQILVKLAVDVVDNDKKHPQGVPLVFDIDSPTSNPEAVKLLDEFGWKGTFPSLRMWRGESPQVDVNGVYGICTLEIG